MARDKRYNTVRNLILGGYLKTFNEIFDTLPKSVLMADLGFNNTRINKVLNDVGAFYANDLFRIAELFDVPEIKIMELVCWQYLADKKAKKDVAVKPKTQPKKKNRQ